MLKFVNKLFGSSSKNKLKSYYKVIETINSLEQEIAVLTDEDLQKPLLFFLSQIIGAEGVEVFEYTADKGVNFLKTTTNKSSNFFLNPA